MSAPAASLRSSRGIARYATVLCALAVIAAVVSFVNGMWIGIVWVLLAGLSSNMAWYYSRRARRVSAAAPASRAASPCAGASGAPAAGSGSAGSGPTTGE